MTARLIVYHDACSTKLNRQPSKYTETTLIARQPWREGCSMFVFSRVAGSTELRAVAIGALFALGGCAGPASIPMAHPGSNAVPQAGFGSSVFGSAFLGCPYPTGDVYQTNISGVTPDPNSAGYTQP